MEYLSKYIMKFLGSFLLLAFCVNFSIASEIDTVIVNRGDRHIYGLFNRLPSVAEGKVKPVAIIAHGFNGTHDFGKNYFKPLESLGYQCYTFDFPCGSVRSRSDNNTVKMSILDEADDLEAVIDYFASREDVDKDNIVVIGESQGGLVASLVSSRSPGKISRLVLIYPALCIPDHHNTRFSSIDSIPEISKVWDVPLGRRFFVELRGLEPYAGLKNFKKPVLIIHGEKDSVVPLSYSERANTVYPDARLKVIEGAGHGFKPAEFTLASDYIKDFLKNNKPAVKSTSLPMHDPVMAYDNGRYWIFSTGFGIDLHSSADLQTWRREPSPLASIPQWPKVDVPAYNGHTWAPDIVKRDGKWYLYYSCSTFGKNLSAIGVAVNTTLDPSHPDYKWIDLGCVIKSQPETDNWNAIDPAVAFDGKGKPWMAFGSFWDGIQLVPLADDMRTPIGTPVSIARRGKLKSDDGDDSLGKEEGVEAGSNAIEAPFIVYHDGWYYLFVSHDYCCRGMRSNYKTVVGRSRDINGPYVDSKGVDMVNGGGDLVAGRDDEYVGVGHCGVYDIDGKYWFIAHGYDRARNGASRLYLKPLVWENSIPVILK